MAQAPPAIAPPAIPTTRAQALAVLGLHESADGELIEKRAAALRKSWHADFASGPADKALRHDRSTAINVAIELLTGKRRAA